MSPTPLTPGLRLESRSNAGKAGLVLLALVVGAGGGYVANRALTYLDELNLQIDSLEETLQRTETEADDANDRADDAEREARLADVTRTQAEENAAAARQQAATADQRATLADQRATAAEESSRAAQEQARLARERADEVRRVAEAEMNRLTEALGRIAETRRTALGLVMSLDEGYLKFDFDRAELRPESREVLSRIAGILLTANDFAITVSGHTDARGTETYNQELSERRARAVADYLIGAGLSGDLFTVEGRGKSQLLEPGDTEEAHLKNRRVELGMVNARIIEHAQLQDIARD